MGEVDCVCAKKTTSETDKLLLKCLNDLVGNCGSVEERAIPAKPSVSDAHLQQYAAMAQENPLMLYMYGKSPDWLQAQLLKRRRYGELLAVKGDAAADRALWLDFLGSYAAQLSRSGALPLAERGTQMNSVNPKYVLRNWVAEEAIRDAEDRRDYTLVRRLLAVLERPFDDHGADVERFCAPASLQQFCALGVSCSS